MFPHWLKYKMVDRARVAFYLAILSLLAFALLVILAPDELVLSMGIRLAARDPLSYLLATLVASLFAGDFLHLRWRRGILLRDTEQIYEPAYDEIEALISSISEYDYANLRISRGGWSSLRKTNRARILETRDNPLYEKLEAFYTRLEEDYDDKLGKAIDISRQITNSLVKERMSPKYLKQAGEATASGTAEQITKIIEGHWTVWKGFFKGKDIRAISRERYGTKDRFVKRIRDKLKRQGQEEVVELDDDFFDELQQRILEDKTIQELRSLRDQLLEDAGELRDLLAQKVRAP